MGWCPLDCIYFSVVVLFTVGYGDLSPTGSAGLLFTMLYSVSAMLLVATAISGLLNTAISAKKRDAKTAWKRLDSFRRAMHGTIFASDPLSDWGGQGNSVGIFDARPKALRRASRFRNAVLSVIFWIAMGTVVFGMRSGELDSNEADAKSSLWVRSFYLSVITITSVGFGDLSPETWDAKIFDILY